MKTNEIAVCVVGDYKFLRKYLDNFVDQVRDRGNYKGEILVLTSKVTPTFLIKVKNKNKLTYKKFTKIKFTKIAENSLKNIDHKDQPNRHIYKRFQWHKIHLFDEFLKNWKYIFYIDINMIIHHDINLILNRKPVNALHARADAFPDYTWTLSQQFDQTSKIYSELNNNFDLSITDYFQTGIMYFDTKIIEQNTKNEIIDLVNTYPISRTNEQGIMNLYFIFKKNIYKQLPEKLGDYTTYYYWKDNDKTIITKQLVSKYK